MDRLPYPRRWGLLVLVAALVANAAARADALSAVQVLRAGGCGGILPAAPPLRRNPSLDRTAAEWAAGRALAVAAEGAGYRGQSTAGVHVSGPDSSVLPTIRRSGCRTVMNQALRDVGVYHRGPDTWLVLAAPPAPTLTTATVAAAAPRAAAPVPASAALATRALQLVNEVRARGARCGQHSVAPAPPMTLSGALAGVAFGHATDMAEHNYFEHEDLAGQSPADRVRAVGYREKLVGENIAYGPKSVEEVVQGWLDSPDHCENIMDPRFGEMGIAYAAGRASARRGLYWVQLLAEPRA
jgi:uncharacterized protein YkwD